jgi:hypothetical protein
MKKSFLIALIIIPFLGNAQKKHFIEENTIEAGATLSSNGATTAVTLNGIQYWGVGKKTKHFKVGLGARLTSAFGNKSLEYITAPALLTSGKKGPGVFFADQIPQNIDTVSLNSTQVNSLNLFLALRYDFKKKWGVEFNIDLVGVSFGGNKNAVLQYGDQTNNVKSTTAKPTLVNALLISDNDLGSLNSEMIVSYNYTSKLKLKAGLSFLFNEYTLSNSVKYTNTIGTNVDTDRYRTKALMFVVGASYALRNRSFKK